MRESAFVRVQRNRITIGRDSLQGTGVHSKSIFRLKLTILENARGVGPMLCYSSGKYSVRTGARIFPEPEGLENRPHTETARRTEGIFSIY